MAIINLTKENFADEITNYDGVALVDFWAEWCGPCKMIAPVIEELAADLEGKAKVAKVDVDNTQELASQYSVMSIPTLIIFKKGEVVEQMVGVTSKEQLLEKVNAAL